MFEMLVLLGFLGIPVLYSLFRLMVKILERPINLEPPQEIPKFKPRIK